MIEYIKKMVPRGELFCQLAEESAELAHAALKLRRAEDGTNPTPVTVEEATENLVEEIADILLVLDALEIDPMSLEVDMVQEKKLRRWAGRLKEYNHG